MTDTEKEQREHDARMAAMREEFQKVWPEIWKRLGGGTRLCVHDFAEQIAWLAWKAAKENQ